MHMGSQQKTKIHWKHVWKSNHLKVGGHRLNNDHQTLEHAKIEDGCVVEFESN